MSKFCQKCGKEMQDNETFCAECGAQAQNVSGVVTNASSNENKGTVGFILGLCSIVAWFIPLFGYPVTICGIVFSSKGLKEPENKSKATVGLVLSIIFLIVTLINSVWGAIIAVNNL